MRKLNPKQARFVAEYLKDLSATKAAIRAGYSPRTAGSQAHDLLKKPEIIAAIETAMAERSQATKIDAAYVLSRLGEIDQMDALDILKEDGSVKPVAEWPKIWRQMISGIEMAELFDGRGDQRQMIGVLKKIKWPDKIKNLELIGRHVGVQAFKDKVEHSGTIGIKGVAERMRRRARQA